jgi:hypothetical protein
MCGSHNRPCFGSRDRSRPVVLLGRWEPLNGTRLFSLSDPVEDVSRPVTTLCEYPSRTYPGTYSVQRLLHSLTFFYFSLRGDCEASQRIAFVCLSSLLVYLSSRLAYAHARMPKVATGHPDVAYGSTSSPLLHARDACLD